LVRAVTTNHIRNDAVTNAKIADLAVDTDQIAADAVTYAKIQNVSATNRVLGRDSSGAGNVEEISPSALRTMINVENGATADQTASEIKTAYESNTNTNAFTDAEQTKLSGIEAGATADQTASEIKTAYESNADTNAFTDTEQTKLSGIAAGAEVNPSNATTSASGLMSTTDKTKLDGIATSANNYSHPTGDGNLHVSATGTNNTGKVLTAGSSAGSFSWQTAPGQSVVEGSWTLTNASSLSFSEVGTYISGSDLYYHRYGRLAVLSGIISFNKTTSDYFITNYGTGSSGNPNYAFLEFDNPVDTLASGGTAKIYPIGLEGSGATAKKKTTGHGYAEWFGGTTNTTTSSPQRYLGISHCAEDPGNSVFTLEHDKTELTVHGPPDGWYAGGVFFEYSFLLDPAFA
jgi:hypothetical protein